MTGCSDELAVMLRAADGAAQLLRDQFARPERLRVDEKAASDFVSSADLRSQEVIRGVLSDAYPAYSQLLEEGLPGDHEAAAGAPRFIVDPLDGTTNFLHGIPHFAVSIALEKDGDLTAGVVHDVVKGEIFSCERGKGAWLGMRQIHGSPERELPRSVVGTGIPHHGRPYHRPYLAALAAIMPCVAGVRRMGSAALDLAYVAAGRFEAFFELGLAPWDVAAGTLLVREAGGIVTGVDGRPAGVDSGDILASSFKSLHRNMVDWLVPLHGVHSRPAS
jgi:myo-inositol-1(or 4)-monophosphatase